MNTVKLIFVFYAISSIGCSSKEYTPTDVQPKNGVVNVNGMDLSYFMEGTGIPCIVIGGSSACPSKAISEELRDHFMFVFADGRMTLDEHKVGELSDVTMDTLTDDIEKLRLALDLGKVVIWGHSISGILALEYARKYPKSVTHVVMHAAPPLWNSEYLETVDDFWQEQATDDRKRILKANWTAIGSDSISRLSSSEAGILGYITNAPRYFHDPTYDPAWLFEGAYWNEDGWNHIFDNLMPDYDLENGPVVQRPVFLAIGKDDYAVPYISWTGEQEKIPNLSYNLFEKSGHYPMLEEHELFDQKLLKWIGENSATDKNTEE